MALGDRGCVADLELALEISLEIGAADVGRGRRSTSVRSRRIAATSTRRRATSRGARVAHATARPRRERWLSVRARRRPVSSSGGGTRRSPHRHFSTSARARATRIPVRSRHADAHRGGAGRPIDAATTIARRTRGARRDDRRPAGVCCRCSPGSRDPRDAGEPTRPPLRSTSYRTLCRGESPRLRPGRVV